MLNPAIGKLLSEHESRYSLVIAVAKRARQIAMENEKKEIISTEKPVDIALTELSAGRYWIREEN